MQKMFIHIFIYFVQKILKYAQNYLWKIPLEKSLFKDKIKHYYYLPSIFYLSRGLRDNQ